MKVSLTNISNKLMELTDKRTEIYPSFYLAELKYVSAKAKIMLEQANNFAAQPLREAAVQELLSQTPEYEEYHKLYPEMNIIDSQIRVYLQLSRNLNAIGWEVSNNA